MELLRLLYALLVAPVRIQVFGQPGRGGRLARRSAPPQSGQQQYDCQKRQRNHPLDSATCGLGRRLHVRQCHRDDARRGLRAELLNRTYKPITAFRDRLDQVGLARIIVERLTQFGDALHQGVFSDSCPLPELFQQFFFRQHPSAVGD
jgi:hypothetical protein